MELMKNPQEIRTKLIEAGYELFTETGYAETTIRMITKKAEVDNRSFYYLFESKEDLLRTVVEDLADNEIEKLEEIARMSAGPLDKLSAMIDSVISSRRGRALMMGLAEKKSAYFTNVFREYFMLKAGALVQGVVEEGIREGVMHAPELTSEFILSGLIFLFLSTVNADEIERERMLRAYLHITETSFGLQEGSIRVAF